MWRISIFCCCKGFLTYSFLQALQDNEPMKRWELNDGATAFIKDDSLPTSRAESVDAFALGVPAMAKQTSLQSQDPHILPGSNRSQVFRLGALTREDRALIGSDLADPKPVVMISLILDLSDFGWNPAALGRDLVAELRRQQTT